MVGTISVLDVMEEKTIMRFKGITDLAALNTFATGLQAYCVGDLRERAVRDKSKVVGTPGTGPYGSVEHKAVIVYEDLGAGPEDTAIFRFELATPDDAIYEDVKDKGKRVTQAAGDAIVALMNTATGGNFRFVRGYPKGKRIQGGSSD